MKKAQIWVSAVLYMALGVVLVSIIIAVGIPVIDKIKDKYTITQTKELFFKLDGNIRAVYNEGEGSQRPVKLDIGRGEAKIDQDGDIISWQIRTKTLLSEPNMPIQEGNLNILTELGGIEGEYIITLTLDYGGVLDLKYEGSQSFSGLKRLSIINTGENVGGALPAIELIEL